MSEHITIGDVSPRAQYIANGTQHVFTFAFPIFNDNDLEIRINGLTQATGFSIAGAGESNGGTVTFLEAPANGARIMLRRRVILARMTDFQENSLLRASALNDELDFQMAALQQVASDLSQAIRTDPADDGNMLLPLRAARGNRLLGFDSLGDIAIFDREGPEITLPYPGAVPRAVEDKLNERLSVRDFGALGNGVADDGPALQAAMNAAVVSGRFLEIGEGSYRTGQPLLLGGGAAGLIMRGSILYAGPSGQTALTIGDGGTVRNATKLYMGIRIIRASISDWENEADIGLVLRNFDSCQVEIRQVEGFTIGIRTLGEERGFEDTTLTLGRIVNNRIGLDIRTASAGAWNTSVRYYGGHFAIASSLHITKDRFGVRFSAAPGAYVAHNRHIFDAPGFELQARNRPISGIPFLCEVNSRAIWARAMRMEGCSPFVARHTAGAQDHVYEIAWASQAYLVDVDYTPSATRIGASVRRFHQAAAFRDASREVAAVPNLRAARFRWSIQEWGFEKLACLSTNVSFSPTRLEDFAFPGLDDFTFTDRGVLLNGGRGLGFVVDTRNCREFALAVDADGARLVVMCFDQDRYLISEGTTPVVRASGQSLMWNATARWWQSSADMDDETFTRPQVIRLGEQVAYAIIGVARIARDYEVRSLRLACDPLYAPSLLYGMPDLPHGARELAAESPWDPGSIAAGASAQINVPLQGARPGDFATAAFSLATSGIVMLAQVGATNIVTVTAWNRSGIAINLAAGTVRARVTKA